MGDAGVTPGSFGKIDFVIDEYASWVPGPELRPFVAWATGYRQAGVPPQRHRGLPSPWLTLIVTLDDPLVIESHPDPRQPGAAYDTLLGGLHTSPALITHDGRQSGVQLGLTPLGARRLAGLPAGELAQTDLAATDVLGGFAAELRERVAAERAWDRRFAVIGSLFGRRVGGGVRVAAAADLARHGARVGTRAGDRVERAVPVLAVPRGDRAGAQGRGP